MKSVSKFLAFTFLFFFVFVVCRAYCDVAPPPPSDAPEIEPSEPTSPRVSIFEYFVVVLVGEALGLAVGLVWLYIFLPRELWDKHRSTVVYAFFMAMYFSFLVGLLVWWIGGII